MISPEKLRRFPFFVGFDDAQLKALAMIADEHEVGAKITFFEEGHPAQKFFLLVDGSIDIYIKSEEDNDPASRRDFAVGEINPGEVFGISAVLKPYIHNTTMHSAVNSKVIEFDGAALRALMQSDQGFAHQIMLQIAQALMGRLNSTRVQLAAAWA